MQNGTRNLPLEAGVAEGLGIATYPNTLPTGLASPERNAGRAGGDDGGLHNMTGLAPPGRGAGGWASSDTRMSLEARQRELEDELVRLRSSVTPDSGLETFTATPSVWPSMAIGGLAVPRLQTPRERYEERWASYTGNRMDDPAAFVVPSLRARAAAGARQNPYTTSQTGPNADIAAREGEIARLESLTASLRTQTQALQAATQSLHNVRDELDQQPPPRTLRTRNTSGRITRRFEPVADYADYISRNQGFANWSGAGEDDLQEMMGPFVINDVDLNMGYPGTTSRDDFAAVHARRIIASRPRSRLSQVDYEDTITPIRPDEPRLLISNNDMSVKLFAIRQPTGTGNAVGTGPRWGEVEAKGGTRKLAKIGGTKFDTAVNHSQSFVHSPLGLEL